MHQYEATRAKAEAELAQAQRGGPPGQRSGGPRRSAWPELALSAAEREESATPEVAGAEGRTHGGADQGPAKTREARERLARARIPVDESGVAGGAAGAGAGGAGLRREARRAGAEAEGQAVARSRRPGWSWPTSSWNEAQAVIRSPIDGVVTAGDVKVGDVLEPGKPVVEIARQAGFRFEAAIPSEEIGHVRVGMPVRIKLDAYDLPDGTAPWTGRSASSPRTRGWRRDRHGTVYTVRIATSRDEIGRGAYRGRVKLGMTGRAEIVTGRDRLLTLLVGRLRQTISLN